MGSWKIILEVDSEIIACAIQDGRGWHRELFLGIYSASLCGDWIVLVKQTPSEGSSHTNCLTNQAVRMRLEIYGLAVCLQGLHPPLFADIIGISGHPLKRCTWFTEDSKLDNLSSHLLPCRYGSTDISGISDITS